MSSGYYVQCDTDKKSADFGKLYVKDIVQGNIDGIGVSSDTCTITTGNTFAGDHCGWSIGGDDTHWLSTGTITLGGTVELEGKMHVYEVIAVNRRTLDVLHEGLIVADSRDKALVKAASSMKLDNIDDWQIEVRKMFSFEPIESDK